MNKNYEKLVNDVVKSINWSRVKYYHQVFGIKWQFQEKEDYITERYPTVTELKEELRTLLSYAIVKNTPALDYANWIIYWKDEQTSKKEGLEGASLEAIFSLESSIAIENSEEENEALDNVKKQMGEAVTKEEYEKAAKLRDKINFLEKRKKYD